MRFSKQGYRSGLPFPSPGDLPNPGIESGSPAQLQVDSLPPEPPGKPLILFNFMKTGKDEESSEEKLEASRAWFKRLRKDAIYMT